MSRLKRAFDAPTSPDSGVTAEAYATLELFGNSDAPDEVDTTGKITVSMKLKGDERIFQNAIMYQHARSKFGDYEVSEETLRRFGEEVVRELAECVMKAKR